MSRQFLLIIGPPAVGKATIAKELAHHLDYKYIHNHKSIEYVRNIFDFGEGPFWDFVGKIRKITYDYVSESEVNGFIDTLVWAFDLEGEQEYVNRMCNIFKEQDWNIRIIELLADQETRLSRNKNPDRLKEKPSKRDIEQSNQNLLETDDEYILESPDDQEFPGKHFKLDTTDLEVDETVSKVLDWLNSS